MTATKSIHVRYSGTLTVAENNGGISQVFTKLSFISILSHSIIHEIFTDIFI